MSYSINEGVDDAKARVLAYQAIRERFPDARLNDRIDGESVWFANDATAKADGVELVVGGKNEVYFYRFVELAGGRCRVYLDNWMIAPASLRLETLRKKHPEAYAALVAVCGKP